MGFISNLNRVVLHQLLNMDYLLAFGVSAILIPST